MFSWGGRLRQVPEDFTFPKGSPRIAWLNYCCGDPDKAYPPLRLLTHHDMANKSMMKRHSEYRLLMGAIEEVVQAKGMWTEVSSNVFI